MRIVQMTLDKELVKQVDKIARETGTTRSAFTRDALRQAIRRVQVRRMEEQHRQGYMRKPVSADEFTGWEPEQVWGD